MIYEVEVEFKSSHIILVEAPGKDEASEIACERLEDIDRGGFAMDDLEVTHIWISEAMKDDYVDPDRD